MRLAPSVRRIPGLENVESVTDDNCYHVCSTIAKSQYPNKGFTIASIFCEITGAHQKIWLEYFTKVIDKNFPTDDGGIVEFFEKSFDLVEKVEDLALTKFGEQISDATL